MSTDWVPVEEGLPIEWQHVLVTIKEVYFPDQPNEEIHYYTALAVYSGKWFFVDGDDDHWPVVAWTTVPEPYKP